MNITFPHTFFPKFATGQYVVNNIGGLKVADRTGVCHFLANLQIRDQEILLYNITYKSLKIYCIT